MEILSLYLEISNRHGVSPLFQVPPSKKGAPNELGTLNNLLWVRCPHLPTQELFVLETTPRTTKIKD